MTDATTFLSHHTETLRGIEAEGLTKRERLILGPQGARVTLGSGPAVNLCANNYLGLANHPALIAAARLAQAMAADLDARGVYVAGLFFPVVPRGQARIRTQMNAALTRDDLDFALDAFRAAGKTTGALA